MRVVVIGQAAFGKAVVEAIADAKKDDLAGVFPPPTKENTPADPISDAARARGINVLQPGRYRSPAAIEAFRALQPDLCVMAYVTDIVPEEMLFFPRLGTIQYHPSLLPRHRGPSSINWPIIQGETQTGLTIFWPDRGLDTGPILLQKTVEIGPDDTLASLYFNRLFPLGVQAILESLDLVRAGRAPKIPQDESKATYEGWCNAEQAKIDWSMSADQVYNLIRGCNPQPGAHTTYQGQKLAIFDSQKITSRGKPGPGTITNISDAGLEVAAKGGAILVKRVQPPASKKIPAHEFASASGLKTSDRFGD
ncbi:MAG: methionyl-tRNA formyltransferase [Chloroflexi bacterium]|nr:methionyl-tRNA formyltransferase [Chloroflexota bacterium]